MARPRKETANGQLTHHQRCVVRQNTFGAFIAFFRSTFGSQRSTDYANTRLAERGNAAHPVVVEVGHDAHVYGLMQVLLNPVEELFRLVLVIGHVPTRIDQHHALVGLGNDPVGGHQRTLPRAECRVDVEALREGRNLDFGRLLGVSE